MVLICLMRSNNNLKIFLVIACGLMTTSCSYRINKNASNLDSIFVSNQQLESISYQEVKNKVFIPKCISCHGNSGGVNLEDYSSARSHINQITDSAILNRTMPKAGSEPLSSEEYLLLVAWVKAGGPEKPSNGGNPPAPNPVEVLKPEFASMKKIIIDRKCISCHRVDGKAPRVLLDTAKEMIDSPLDIVLPENPDESGLILTLDRENSTKPMPPLDSGITAVSKEDLEVIKEWIRKGAKD